MYYTHLPTRGLLSLTGDDMLPFLQGLITADIHKLAPQKPLYAALLSSQGKFLHDFFLVQQEGRVILDGEKHRLADLKQRLALYKLRSKVTIESLPESEGVVAVWGSLALGLHGSDNIVIDPRMPELGFRLVGDVAKHMEWCAAQGYIYVDENAYDKHRIMHGVPDGSRDMTPDKSLMLEFNMDMLNAVDFSKGCYVGQEVTARTKYRAQLRKILCIVESADAAFPDAGATLSVDGKDIGQMLSHAGNTGLALMRIEALEQGKTFTLDSGAIVAAREIFSRG